MFPPTAAEQYDEYLRLLNPVVDIRGATTNATIFSSSKFANNNTCAEKRSTVFSCLNNASLVVQEDCEECYDETDYIQKLIVESEEYLASYLKSSITATNLTFVSGIAAVELLQTAWNDTMQLTTLTDPEFCTQFFYRVDNQLSSSEDDQISTSLSSCCCSWENLAYNDCLLRSEAVDQYEELKATSDNNLYQYCDPKIDDHRINHDHNNDDDVYNSYENDNGRKKIIDQGENSIVLNDDAQTIAAALEPYYHGNDGQCLLELSEAVSCITKNEEGNDFFYPYSLSFYVFPVDIIEFNARGKADILWREVLRTSNYHRWPPSRTCEAANYDLCKKPFRYFITEESSEVLETSLSLDDSSSSLCYCANEIERYYGCALKLYSQQGFDSDGWYDDDYISKLRSDCEWIGCETVLAKTETKMLSSTTYIYFTVTVLIVGVFIVTMFCLNQRAKNEKQQSMTKNINVVEMVETTNRQSPMQMEEESNCEVRNENNGDDVSNGTAALDPLASRSDNLSPDNSHVQKQRLNP